MMIEYSEEGGAGVFEFGASIGEEERKSMAQYAYHLDRRIRDVSFHEGRMFVRTKGGAPLDARLCQDIRRWAEKVKLDAPALEVRVLQERTSSRTPPEAPMAELRRSGMLMEEGSGLFALRGEVLSLRSALDERIRKEALARGAIEHEYPSLLSLDTLVRSGYLNNFPHHVQFVSEMDRGSEALRRVQGAGGAGFDEPSEMDGALTTSDLVVSPTICYHCFRVHQGATLGAGRLFTALGKCGRKEPFVGPLDRLQMFTMREIIAFGAADDVEAERRRWMAFAWEIVERLDLTARIVTAFDPFFGQAANKKIYQALVEAKYELQLFLPAEQRWCAVASFNHHAATLTRAFAVEGEEGPIESGCIGFGYERWIVGIVSQLGTSLEAHAARLRA